MSLSHVLTFQEFVAQMQDEVRHKIDQEISDDDMRYAIEGGKLLRPVMLVLSFKACSNGQHDQLYQRALESAVGIELAHSASLLHDDIMDDDAVRRGKPALHVTKGVGNAILTGHRMISQAFRISVEHGLQNAQIFLDTWDDTLVGQLRDIDLNAHLEKIFEEENSTELLMQEYLRVIEMKTASLFATACRAGAIEARASDDVRSTMAEYGRNVGLAYQIADDMVDIAEGKMEEGIIMPLLKAFGTDVDEHTIDLLEKGKLSIEEELEKKGTSLEEVYEQGITHYVQRSQDIADSSGIPDSSYKNLLREAPVYITNKMTEKIGVTV
ncbi:MAG: polyprenyl synthetase family protein [Thermoplasmatota archaeon]